MKPSPISLIVMLVLCGLLFFGSLVGTAMFIISPSVTLPTLPPRPKPPAPKVPIEQKVIKTEAKTMDHLAEIADQLDSWQKELLNRQKAVLQKEEELNRQETLLKAEKDTMAKRRDEFLQLQTKFDGKIVRLDDREKKYYADQAEVFTKMNIEDTISYFIVYPDAELVKILPNIPLKQRIKLLEAWGKRSEDERKRSVRIGAQVKLLEQIQSQDQPATVQAQPVNLPTPPTP